MTVVDLHPEDLLDKEIRGELTDGERVRLETHLSKCHVCRLEHDARALFTAERDDALPVEYSSKLIAVALGAALPPEAPPMPAEEEPRRPSARRVRRARRHPIWYVAAAALLTVGAAVASEDGAAWLAHAVGLEPTVSDRHPEAPPDHTPRPITMASASLERAEPTAPIAPTPLVSAPASTASVTAASLAPVRGPQTLFDDANDARRHGDFARATTLLRELQTKFPQSR
jgi:hypothetical protein